MSAHKEEPSSPAKSQSDNEQDDTSSHTSNETIDSLTTSPSHSITADEDVKTLAPNDQSSSPLDEERKAATDSNHKTVTDEELISDPKSIQASSAEIQEFSHLVEELSLFASSIVAPTLPLPTHASADLDTKFRSSPNLSLNINHNPHIDIYNDADKTPTQASISASSSSSSPTSASTSTSTSTSAAFQASQEAAQAAQEAHLYQRKAEIQADLLELIRNEEDERNRELLMGIELLMRDWKVLYERLERWRGERKGERVRERYKREF